MWANSYQLLSVTTQKNQSLFCITVTALASQHHPRSLAFHMFLFLFSVVLQGKLDLLRNGPQSALNCSRCSSIGVGTCHFLAVGSSRASCGPSHRMECEFGSQVAHKICRVEVVCLFTALHVQGGSVHVSQLRAGLNIIQHLISDF